MEGILKISLFAFFLLTLISKGIAQQGQCDVNDLIITQVQTGARVQNKAEWKVTVKNNCICTQDTIQLSCSGFQTLEPIDPSILTIGNTCSLLPNNRLYGFRSVSFRYAWDTQFPFAPVSSIVSCS